MTARERNTEAMVTLGLEVGDVRRCGHALATILGPGQNQPGGRSLVLCSLDGEGDRSGDPVEVELLAERVATFPLIPLRAEH